MSARRVGVVLALFALAFSQSSTGATDEDRIEALARDLKSKDAKVRLKAADELGKFGPKAADYAKELCDTLLDSDPAVAKAALKAFERVRPDLHKPLTQFLLDKYPKIRLEGAKGLGALGLQGEPAAFFLAKSLAASVAKDKDGKGLGPIDNEIFTALLKIGSEEPEVIEVLKALAGPGMASVGHRARALELLADWAAGNDERRKELLPLIKSGLETTGLEAACCGYAARYGTLSKDLLPLLKPLQFGRDAAVREESTKAVEAIEAAIKKK